MKKLVVWYENESSIDIKEFGNEGEAIRYAEMIWCHLTKEEKKARAIIVGYVDVEALDVWKIIKKY